MFLIWRRVKLILQKTKKKKVKGKREKREERRERNVNMCARKKTRSSVAFAGPGCG